CREYRSAVQRQRRSLAAILPVAPVAGLREAILGATSGSATGGSIATGGGLLASSAFKGLVMKGLIGLGVALVAGGGTVAVVGILDSHGPSSAMADTGTSAAVAAQHALRVDDPPFGRVAGARDSRLGSSGHEST